jgi:hypothetical protein
MKLLRGPVGAKAPGSGVPAAAGCPERRQRRRARLGLVWGGAGENGWPQGWRRKIRRAGPKIRVRLRRGRAGDLGRAAARPLRGQGRKDGDDRRARFVRERKGRCARGLSKGAVRALGRGARGEEPARAGETGQAGLALRKENGPAAGPCGERRREKRRARGRKWARGEKKRGREGPRLRERRERVFGLG